LALAASRLGDEARPDGEPGPAVAARAAVSAAAALRVTGVEPVILADGANVIVHLTPSPLVAKVPASTTAIRPGIGAWLAKELDLATFLTAAGAPVMAPSAEVPATVHHADAGAGNLMATGGQWIWHDFEDACSGPVAWDLAATTASPRFDRARILSGYAGPGEPAGQAQLRACEQLRRLHLTIWYCLYAERRPDCRQRAAELLASWRAS
jgi:hypothetical protein